MCHGCISHLSRQHCSSRMKVNREDQDKFAVYSRRGLRVHREWRSDCSSVCIFLKGLTEVKRDEFPHHGSNIEALCKLIPCFLTDGAGIVTSASGINDGAAALVLMKKPETDNRGLTPLAQLVSGSQESVELSIMGTGPSPAITLLQKQISHWRMWMH